LAQFEPLNTLTLSGASTRVTQTVPNPKKVHSVIIDVLKCDHDCDIRKVPTITRLIIDNVFVNIFVTLSGFRTWIFERELSNGGTLNITLPSGDFCTYAGF
jgi:hypothetical protein